MAIPTTRSLFKDYCLRKLGFPVININVSDDQVEDRVDEALQVYSEKHFDASEKTWLAYELTQIDIDNGFIILPTDILSVDQIMDLASVVGAFSDDSLFSYRYQIIMDNLSPFRPLDTLNYYMSVVNLNETNDLINVTETFEFTRHKNKLKIHNDISDFKVGAVLAFHVYKIIDPLVDPSVWNDKWLKEYATALIKRQWGSNMKKHSEIQLLGGVTINGQQLFDEAILEVQTLEERLETTYMEPIDFFIG